VSSSAVAALPVVSIVSPSLNQGPYIEDTIRSVLAQDYPRIEYVVRDGGSTDGSLAVLERYTGRVRWVSGPDGGQAAAINQGLRESTGEILAWLNCDDTYEPGAVSAAVQFLRDHPEVMLVYGDATLTDARGTEIGPCAQVEPFALERLVHHGDIVVQPAAFFRREAFLAVGGLDESLHWTLDYDLWLKIGRRYGAAYLPRKLARCRWTGENKTSVGGFARLAEIESVARRHGAGGLPAAFRLEKLALSLREARARARAGDLLSAAGLALRGTWAVAASGRAIRYVAGLVGRRLRARGNRPGPPV
jgi:hypothetical protein